MLPISLDFLGLDLRAGSGQYLWFVATFENEVRSRGSSSRSDSLLLFSSVYVGRVHDGFAFLVIDPLDEATGKFPFLFAVRRL